MARMRPSVTIFAALCLTLGFVPSDANTQSSGAEEQAATIRTRFPSPAGYDHVRADSHSVAAKLPHWELLPPGTAARDWRGRIALSADEIGAVLAWDLLGSVEQCADVAMRLVADHARGTQAEDSIAFSSLSGQTISWSRWRTGRYTTNAAATRIVYRPDGPTRDDEDAFADYLRFVMTYANTASLVRDWPQVSAADIKVGDVLIHPPRTGSSMGHLSIVVDACEDTSGARRYIFADGYTPARMPVVRQRVPGDPVSVWMTPAQYLDYQSRFGPGDFHRFPGW